MPCCVVKRCPVSVRLMGLTSGTDLIDQFGGRHVVRCRADGRISRSTIRVQPGRCWNGSTTLHGGRLPFGPVFLAAVFLAAMPTIPFFGGSTIAGAP